MLSKLEEVITEELKKINSRRTNFNSEKNIKDNDNASNLFGIALSGGGIRSAIINLGVLKIFNSVGILRKADYLSMVSGGSYIGGYIQSKLFENRQKDNPFNEIFGDDDISHFKNYGNYLSPGECIKKLLNKLRLLGAFVFSLAMNIVWVLSFFLLIYYLMYFPLASLSKYMFSINMVSSILWITTAIVFIWHFFFHGLRHYRLWSSNALNIIEGVLLIFIVFYLLSLDAGLFSIGSLSKHFNIQLSINLPQLLGYNEYICDSIITLFLFVATGFFSNPNILSIHRFYRDRLATAFLIKSGGIKKAVKIHELIPQCICEYKAPYPLINTCLNLSGSDDKFKGKKASDYFLLSPLYCGSTRTGYVESDSRHYNKITLATAIAASGAAVNPNMGRYTNSILAFVMSILNLKLGYWIFNPHKSNKCANIVWWPIYLISELLGKTDTTKRMVNISDGGHIENLGIYELLRRRVKLIIAIDAVADPEYEFSDLKNLVVRAKNELGINIKFRKNSGPELKIKPKPSNGYSESHFVIADIEELPCEEGEGVTKTGLLVYVKSSMKEPKTRWKNCNKPKRDSSYYYKTFHPTFPHESTMDQFFDEAQWTAYYNLGRFMAGDLLNIDVRNEKQLHRREKQLTNYAIDNWYNYFRQK
ncbi:MAG: hypothetical protein SVZ03_01810 [Spirochaetota bacterium]|nr:hypothetical protein [Spirochaetota bacterium]